ncbi:MAG: hypothetical protein AABY10_00765, partial [Nanoarchaeota archaeon]
RAYGEFLIASGVKKMPVYAVDEGHVNNQTNPFARQLWFSRLAGDVSNLCADYRGLSGYHGVRGVRLVPGEGKTSSN